MFNILDIIWNRHKCAIPNKCNKDTLYAVIDDMRKMLGIELKDYPINIFKIIEQLKDVVDVSFDDLNPKLGGMLIVNEQPNKSAILINVNRNKQFSTAHELIHYLGHGKDIAYLHTNNKDSIEWQANEGAAELLMPYKLFIPSFCEKSKSIVSVDKIITLIALEFNVTKYIAKTRVQSLQYEINQYLLGISIDKINIVTNCMCRFA